MSDATRSDDASVDNPSFDDPSLATPGIAAGRTVGATRAFETWVSRYLAHAPAAVAVVRAADHALMYMNPAFRRLDPMGGQAVVGRSVVDAFGPASARELAELLDRVQSDGGGARETIISPAPGSDVSWRCTAWAMADGAGPSERLVMEMREVTDVDIAHSRQTDIAERLLLSALRDQLLAENANASRQRSAFLSEAAARLGASLDRETTYATIAGLALPRRGAWCIVDIVEAEGGLRRLRIVHPDRMKQALARELEGRWSPEPGDPFGVPLAMQALRPTVIADDIDAVLAAGAHGLETLRILRELGAGPLLVVPLLARGTLRGAITFVSRPDDVPYMAEDIQLAEDLAARCATALDSAQLYEMASTARGTAELAQQDAEAANLAKTQFLATMSHELRTPLNAIAGYAQLLEMGLRGPVTEAQRADLARIQRSQEHLAGLINAVLSFAKLEAGSVQYDLVDVPLDATIASVETLVAPQLLRQGLSYQYERCDASPGDEPATGHLLAHADPEKLRQILLNLLVNAIKFTAAGGRIAVWCVAGDGAIAVHIQDTGRGIPADRLEAIFEPFVQVGRRLTSRDEGVGLGLAISRDMARAMGGDLTVESTLGAGSTFTLTLPRAAADHNRGKGKGE